MRKAVVCGLAVAVVLGWGMAAHAAKSSAVEALHAADAAWEKAYNAGKVDEVVALYDENAVVYAPGAAPARGRAAIQTFFANDIAGFGKTGMTISLGPNADGGVKGDMGWASGTWTVKD